MATHNERRGWQWEDAEREARKEPVRRAQRLAEKLAEQVRRIKAHIPEFTGPAEQILSAVKAGLGKLLALNINNRGPKYHPISPEEADRLIEAAPRVFRLWEAFASSPEFAAAVREANREIRRTNARAREHNRAVEAAYAAAWERMLPALQMIDRGDLSGALDYASENGLL